MPVRLYQCSACDHTISEIAPVCPGCGAPGELARQAKSTSTAELSASAESIAARANTAEQSAIAEPIAAQLPAAPKQPSGWKVVGVFILSLIAFVFSVAYLFAYVVIFLTLSVIALWILLAVLGGAYNPTTYRPQAPTASTSVAPVSLRTTLGTRHQQR